MAETCLGCSDKCPATVPTCLGAKFCAPSYAEDYVPSRAIHARTDPCQDHDAGTLDGHTRVCMGCFGGHDHSRFYTHASGNATLETRLQDGSPAGLAVPALTFGALVRTAPWTDRLWSNLGVGFRSVFLRQVNASRIWFHLRTSGAFIGLNPRPGRYASLPSASFVVWHNTNRYLPATLSFAGHACGPRSNFLFDTGNAGISIQSEEVASGLAQLTGGYWNTSHGAEGNLWIDTTHTAHAARRSPPPELTIATGNITVRLPPKIWAPFYPSSGQTVFMRYDKNVLGLPVIMSGDFYFDDTAMAVWYSEPGVASPSQ